MKPFQIPLFALLLQTCLAKGVGVMEVDKHPEISDDGRYMSYSGPDCEPSKKRWGCTVNCKKKDGTVWSLAEDGDQEYASCCLPDQHLSGSNSTEWLCCAGEHEVAGSEDVGYSCCPTGFSFDGERCKEKKKCSNGKRLVNGKCVCPKGTTEADDGTCQKDEKECTSGLETGKCYTFLASNGHYLGMYKDKWYQAAGDDVDQRYGKFQLCKDEKCKPGQPVNPSDAVYIRDIYGHKPDGKNARQWLNHKSHGHHIGSTSDFEEAGEFSLSKWPCGKYCLSGFEDGVGPTCPNSHPSITFWSKDPQMCVPFELTEVPCDIKSDKNNCIWTNGDQCCDKVHCPAKAA
ncbi:Cysteine-rich secreted protein [Aspergillus sclerotialis]|uniref:Cysteine-rich secreted protein n=1 Tax=Aspergillus sclerotialis TaxID=2070753 RepID=A0A3A2ZUT1_9EURO|nr:Cysteine-rich secreted protein [Aspergillus sclerotialis]